MNRQYWDAVRRKNAPRNQAQVPEHSKIAPSVGKLPTAFVRLRCTRCDWTKRVRREDSWKHRIDHQDFRCPHRLQPHDEQKPTRSLGTWDSPHKSPARIQRPKGSFCPTCREPVTVAHDTRVCPNGCTGVAV